jgi:Ca-activated chloride channel family protein
MRFAEPFVLWGLAGIPFLAALLALAIARRQRALETLAGKGLLDRMITRVGTERRVLKAVLACLAAVFLILALARPQWGMSLDPVVRRGVDVVLAVDVSSSMLVEDIRPSRLDKARGDAGRLLETLDGDRVAVVAFSGSAATLCPLTLDYGAARLFIDALSTDLLSEPGTSFPTAMEEIGSVFGDRERRFRAAVIFSDGEDHQGGVAEAAAAAAEAGIIIHTVGMGTAAGGPIPLRESGGPVRGYKEDREGRVVTSRLEDESLAEIARRTGGSYVASTAGGGELGRIAEALGSMEDREMQQRLLTRYEERFQIPLVLALLCLVADAMIPERRRRRPDGSAARPLAACLLAALAFAFTPAAAASARAMVEEGNRLFEEGRLDEALRQYTQAQVEDPEAPEIHLNIGNVLYRQGEFEKAKEAYRRAFQAQNRALAESARYNSGTASLSAGELESAVEDFREALRLNPEDADARRNLELALMRQQQMQPPPPSQSSTSKEQEGDQESDPDSAQGDRQQPPEDQEQQGQEGEPGEPPPDQAGGSADRKELEEARRILDALRGEDRPRIDRARQRRPEKRPEKDW